MAIRGKRFLDISNTRFNMLTVIKECGKDIKGNYLWECLCDCGNTTVAKGNHLREGHKKSCGCLQKLKASKRATHGNCKNNKETTEYRTWCGMRERCNKESSVSYINYGGRGIKVCDRWQNSFENFLNDMGKKPSPHHSLDRINNNGNYEPSNCRWATRSQQALNQRPRKNKTSKYVGVSLERSTGLWKAQARLTLGRFKTEDEAMDAINKLHEILRNGQAFHWPESEE